MACLIVPAAEAVITTIVTKIVKSKENKKGYLADDIKDSTSKIRFSKKLGWLNKLLWGGSALLAFEHIWHGEIIPTFPFLTAVKTGETAEMLAEMGSAGVTMAVLVTSIWVCMLIVSSIIEKRPSLSSKLVKEGM